VLARLRRALAIVVAITALYAAGVTRVGVARAAGLGVLADVVPWGAAAVVLAVAGTTMHLSGCIRIPVRVRLALVQLRCKPAPGYRLINTSHQVFMNGPSCRPDKRPGRVVPTGKEDIR
jgi:hypothetical protein